MAIGTDPGKSRARLVERGCHDRGRTIGGGPGEASAEAPTAGGEARGGVGRAARRGAVRRGRGGEPRGGAGRRPWGGGGGGGPQEGDARKTCQTPVDRTLNLRLTPANRVW